MTQKRRTPLSPKNFLEIEARNDARRELKLDVSKGSWTYDSFAWIEANTRPYGERSRILVRRRDWFNRLMRKYGDALLDEGITEGSGKHAVQPAHDGSTSKLRLATPTKMTSESFSRN